MFDAAPTAGGGSQPQISIDGVAFTADPAGALVLPPESLLVVADLHLEKGSRWASRGAFLPPWDTAATLDRLAALLDRWRPRRVIALGDSFDDRGGSARLSPDNRERLKALLRGREWLWIAGNHDPLPPTDIGGDVAELLAVGHLTLRHAPRRDAAGEIAGHLHPVARVATGRGSVRRRCFAADATRCVMPAFGAYAGGLNIRDPAYDGLFASPGLKAHVLGRTRVFSVSIRSCVSE
jgi:hypothetical protein